MNEFQSVSECLSVQERYNSDLFTIDAAAKRYFKDTASPFSLRRWIAFGVGKPSVKLKAVRIGGRFLRPCDIAEFIEASADPQLYRKREKTERVEKAKERLRKAGA